MPKVLVCDPIAENGIEILKTAAEVDVQIGLSEDQLVEIAANYDALMVRSQTKITRRVLEAATKLQIVGRAGVGVDNIDVPAATERGVIVVNSPAGNTVAVAELALGMMLSLVRKLIPAHQSIAEGEWKRSKFLGTELYGKTLGIVGVGRIGVEVSRRATAFGMKILGYDPFLTTTRAEQLGIEATSIEDILKRADFVTLHTPLTKETKHLINEQSLSSMKPGAIILNCARGGIIDETALYEALKNGVIGGAGLDVYEIEPPKDNPLRELENVILTPHLGASTEEAQVEVALDVARQIVDVLEGRPPQSAVNLPPLPPEAREFIAPFLPLMEKLGRTQAQIAAGRLEKVEIAYCGDLASYDVRALTRVFLKGLLQGTVENVSYVNAPTLAEARGIEVIEKKMQTSGDYANLVETISTRNDEGHIRTRQVDGTIFNKRDPHITSIQNLRVDVVPDGTLLLIPNHDRPGMIGHVGTILGDAGVNIVGMQVGRRAVGERAVMIINLEEPVSDDVIAKLDAVPDLFGARLIDLR
ncbi:MAG TPA: phosphoglycerate dehydrogenase [Abditibacterium sp.]|jgi:D-3-phosphoglycerate dehydrogenase